MSTEQKDILWIKCDVCIRINLLLSQSESSTKFEQIVHTPLKLHCRKHIGIASHTAKDPYPDSRQAKSQKKSPKSNININPKPLTEQHQCSSTLLHPARSSTSKQLALSKRNRAGAGMKPLPPFAPPEACLYLTKLPQQHIYIWFQTAPAPHKGSSTMR